MRLNLPEFNYRIKEKDGDLYIFDLVRRKFVRLTPEEWVRQHVVHYLVDHLKFPRSLISVEKGLVYNGRRKRADILVFDQEGNPYLVVECKRKSESIGQTTLTQVEVYNRTIGAKYLMITNGVTHQCLNTKGEVVDVSMLNSPVDNSNS